MVPGKSLADAKVINAGKGVVAGEPVKVAPSGGDAQVAASPLRSRFATTLRQARSSEGIGVPKPVTGAVAVEIARKAGIVGKDGKLTPRFR